MGSLYLSRNLSNSSELSNLLTKLFTRFSYYPSHVSRICSDGLYLTTDELIFFLMVVIFIFPFIFLLNLVGDLLVLLISRTIFDFMYFLYCFPVFYFIDFCFELYFFFLVTLTLI